MYDLTLTASHAPTQSDRGTREITIGALLRALAAARPDAEALLEIRLGGSEGRRPNYSGALAPPIQFEPGHEI
ncbi:MAG: hypothetical protein P8I86_03570 [Luminiphilus sp.]|nr:hypothetical protein [Luminiphilus sp.]|tara:strand:+ start:651 stop:869 length:219 start_codon:yes stop_codon:yes gene_type:complete